MDELSLVDAVRKHLGRGPGLDRVSVGKQYPPVYDEVQKVELVTPLQAMKWIAATWPEYNNGMNFSPCKLEKIIAYADTMQRGQWGPPSEGDPIDITHGFVTGGKHRLHAVLLSHTSQRFKINYRTQRK